MTRWIRLSAPDVTGAEEAAVVRAIRSGWVAPLGPEVDAFEEELAAYCGRRYAVALSSGTAALHLGLLALNVGAGQRVATATMTFAATANAITYVGAEPVFVDCDHTATIRPRLLREALEQAASEGRPISAVVPVDLYGKGCDHQAVAEIAAEHGIPVLSDTAESVGAKWGGRPTAAYGAAAVVSFNGNKIMTTSGGGALLTDDKAMAERVRYLPTQARQPVVHYEHTDIGYNYRLSNLLAALGRAQLERLPSMLARRLELRRSYQGLFADVPGVEVLGEPSGDLTSSTHDNWWLTSILVDPDTAEFTPEDLRLALEAAKIEARPLWKPMHRQPVFAGATAVLDGTSERLFATGLALPSGSGMREKDLSRVRRTIEDFLQERSGCGHSRV